jgi:hypothetical protein
MPPSHFFLKNKKKILKNKKKPKKKNEYMLGWPNHPIGGGRPPRLDFFFLKKMWWGHFGNKKVKWVKLPQFETLGG